MLYRILTCLGFSNSKTGMVIPALSMHPMLMSTGKTDFYAVFNFIKVITTTDYKIGEVLIYVYSCNTCKQN